MKYQSSETNEHELSEEHDWVKILENCPPAHGMLLIFVQKLCASFHEYGPCCREEVVDPDAWPFIRERLIARIQKVINVAHDNGLMDLHGIEELQGFSESITGPDSLPDLEELAEEVHQINHRICDALLEKK